MMIKRIIVIFFLLSTPALSRAQTDTLLVEQYCQVIVKPRLLSHKVTIDLDFGEEKKFWNDTRLRNEVGELRKFNTVIDAMNFMGRSGWTFINAYPVKFGETEVYHFAFKKLVPNNDSK